ncbi:hypothetical protein CR513_56358, partial [Mucuna pruriens]
MAARNVCCCSIGDACLASLSWRLTSLLCAHVAVAGLHLLMERKTTGFLFFLLLLLAADVAVKTAEARYCFTESHRFGGLCLSYRNCGHVCKTEGFTGGECRGFRRRCFCTKIC